MAQSRRGICRIASEVYHWGINSKATCAIQSRGTVNRSVFFMDFVIHVVARIVVPLFFLGMAGSAVVIVVSFAEDLKELLEDED